MPRFGHEQGHGYSMRRGSANILSSLITVPIVLFVTPATTLLVLAIADFVSGRGTVVTALTGLFMAPCIGAVSVILFTVTPFAVVQIPAYAGALLLNSCACALLDRAVRHDEKWRLKRRWRLVGIGWGLVLAIAINLLMTLWDERMLDKVARHDVGFEVSIRVIGTIACLLAGAMTCGLRWRLVYGRLPPPLPGHAEVIY